MSDLIEKMVKAFCDNPYASDKETYEQRNYRAMCDALRVFEAAGFVILPKTPTRDMETSATRIAMRRERDLSEEAEAYGLMLEMYETMLSARPRIVGG